MNTTIQNIIMELLQRYKKCFLKTALSDDNADELYKWQLITDCHEKSDAEIIRNFKNKNIVDAPRVNIVLSRLLETDNQQLVNCFQILKNEDISLSERLSLFKKAMDGLCGDRFKVKANDERTAAAFLACCYPEKYTFFKDEIYQNYCSYIGEKPRAAGEKYPHYLQLIRELAEIIRQDHELNEKFQNETKGLIQSNLLTAQNILWQMKDSIMDEEGKNSIQGLIVRDNTGWQKDFLEDMSESGYGVIWKHQLSDIDAVLPQLNSIIEARGTFDFYNISNSKTNYKYTIIDFATKKDYESKKENWESKKPCWFSKDFSDYSDDNKSAQIVFLVNKVEEIQPEFQISIDDFETFNNKKASVQNAVAYVFIKTKMFKQIMKQLDIYTKILNLKKNIILQGAPGTGKTYNTAALALSICGEAIPEAHEDVMNRYEELQKEGRIGFCTFHQSMDYEDFVEGIKPIKPDEGELYYKVEDGIFKTMCKNAINKDSQNSVLIIDEINRGNVSKIFGELITLLEADKRIGGDHPIKVTLPYSKESFGVPSNLYIIGTMNTTDRSVGNIDYAVRRRFAFVTLESKEEVIEQHYKNDETLKSKALNLFKSVKSFLMKHKFDMDIADLMVGHSYFLAKNEEELDLKWKYEIVPLLHEYYKDGITKQDVKADTSIDDFCNSK